MSGSPVFGTSGAEGSPTTTTTTTANITPSDPKHLISCPKCRGQSTLRKTSKKKSKPNTVRSVKCLRCDGTGLTAPPPPTIPPTEASPSEAPPPSNETTVAIIGGGIGGFALALALQQRAIPHIVFERDSHFDSRKQGYGLTMQQGARTLRSLGFWEDNVGIHSKRHVVFDSLGVQLGMWGMKVWGRPENKKDAKRKNAHIARQELRKRLMDSVKCENVRWGSALRSYWEDQNGVTIQLDSGEEFRANLLVGADGIRSAVRTIKFGDRVSPLRYLGCIVILGITNNLPDQDLTDGETVFQMADGVTRLYAMPFCQEKTMWQLSFPQDLDDWNTKSPKELKETALRKCGSWHQPVPQLLESTPTENISGYPVYDRDMLSPEEFRKEEGSRVTMIGDAAHPMSPFKGQGANQALVDAVSLARSLSRVFGEYKKIPMDQVLGDFEKEMLERSAVKVKASAEAAKFLHSEVAVMKGNVTRGAAAKNNEKRQCTEKDPTPDNI